MSFQEEKYSVQSKPSSGFACKFIFWLNSAFAVKERLPFFIGTVEVIIAFAFCLAFAEVEFARVCRDNWRGIVSVEKSALRESSLLRAISSLL